jgi:hypothetical protein
LTTLAEGNRVLPFAFECALVAAGWRRYTGQSMENTGQVLFQDDSPRWFIAVGAEWSGPLTASDIYERVLLHEITWAHYVWRKGLAGWSRLCDLEEFKLAVPGTPMSAPPAKVPQMADAVQRAAQLAKSQAGPPVPPVPRSEPAREWYLFYNDAQFGPFSEEEVMRLLRSGRINARVHAWTAGMAAWSRLMKVPSFQAVVEELTAAHQGGPVAAPVESALRESVVREQRKSPRAPMTARLLMSDNREVFEALCRDVSTGGMQVLTSWMPGRVGMHLRLNITPGIEAGAKERKSSPLKPFVAEGVVVRLLEDGRGFSFRFEKLSPEARGAIEEYIKTSGN